MLAALTGSAPAGRADSVITRVDRIAVSATAWRPGPRGTLVTSVQVTTSRPDSDQLDAAIAAGGAAAAVYHRRVSVGEITDLASCDGGQPPPAVAAHWLFYGPLLIPGRSGGPAAPAEATLTVRPVARVPAGRSLAITLYFAHAGPVTVRLPVART